MGAGIGIRDAQTQAARSDLFPQIFLGGGFKFGLALNRDDQNNPFLKDDFNFTELGAVIGFKQSLAFARTHHPELAKLISRLKNAGNRPAYDKAVLELFRTAERLERAKVANPKRYELMLELWKLESQARLMVAQQAMKPDDDRDARLKRTLRRRAELRREMLAADIKRSRERIGRIETQLKALENLDAAADRELRRLQRAVKMT